MQILFKRIFFSLHFTRSMSTASLTEVNVTLGKFLSQRVPKHIFEPEFSNFNYYIANAF
jgi:hypothetical protein